MILSKDDLRRQVRDKKRTLSLEDKMRRSAPIMEQLQSIPAFCNAKVALFYWSMADEVHTHDAVNRYYRDKTVLLPCVDGDDLLLRRYTGPDCLHPGEQFGIDEPAGPLFSDTGAIDVIIVPGVAFDRTGNRMGRGRGFYDRLLATTPHAYKIGVAFNFQIFDNIPTDPHDIPMDIVLTEK